MRFPRRPRHSVRRLPQPGAHAGREPLAETPVAHAEAVAYLTMQQSRKRIDQLMALADGLAASRLRRVHAELGMATYLISENIPAARREALLDEAAGGCRRDGTNLRRIRAELTALLATAADAIDRALTVPELSAHVLEAGEHLDGARELLAALFRGEVAGRPAPQV